MLKNKFFLLIIGVVIVGGIGWWLTNNPDDSGAPAEPTKAAVDVLLNFMDDWMDALEATSTDPVTVGLLENPILAPELKEQLRTQLEDEIGTTDPVLCRATVPGGLRTKMISETDRQVQFYVRGTGDPTPEQGVVTMEKGDGRWIITDISCSFGEDDPRQGEYDFEREGQLLKSVPPPLDPNFWYLVYEDQGLQGLTAKLMFDDASVCVDSDGSESTCNPDSFRQTAAAFVQGDASEEGITVRRLELR